MASTHRQRPDPERHGDLIRRQYGLHFNDCEAVGRHSPVYFAYFCRDLTPYLLAALRELETRASMVLAGEPRRRVLALLYDQQDDCPDRLAGVFINGSDDISVLRRRLALPAGLRARRVRPHGHHRSRPLAAAPGRVP